MTDDYGNEFVTVRELYDSIDELKDEIGGEGGLRQQLTELRTEMRLWTRIAPVVAGLVAAFGPEAANAALNILAK